MKPYYFLIGLLPILLVGCVAPATNYVQRESTAFTLGKAQMVLHKGMPQAEVVQSLGAPNMVTRDRDGVETWVYDKQSTEAISTQNSTMGTVLLLTAKGSQSASQSTQRTLTLILKFKDAVLSDYSYNSTSF